MKRAGVCDLVVTHISGGQNTLKSEGFGDRGPRSCYNFFNVGYAIGCFYGVFAVFAPEMWVTTRSVTPDSQSPALFYESSNNGWAATLRRLRSNRSHADVYGPDG